ncbi:hypothetical protein SUDANB95_01958 [Actinosynnema sp. ALI-1.44]
MKPKLRADTLYVPSADGTYLMNNQKTVTLPGAGTYPWIERLAPHLDGSRTVEQLTSGLAPDKRDAVAELVRFLLDQGFAVDVGEDLPHGLDPAELRAYEAEIAFIGYFRDSAAHRFERYRRSRVLAVGSGRTLAALVHGALHTGLAEPHVLALGDSAEEQRESHERHLDAARERDPRQSLVHLPAPDWHDVDEVRATLRRYDVVLHVDDRPFPGRARLLNRIRAEDGGALVQAVVLGDRAWIGPLVSPDRPRSCWECAWRRARPGRLEDFADHPECEPSDSLAGPPAALVANYLVFESFKFLTDAAPLDTSHGMVTVDLETLRTDVHTFVPDPRCTVGHEGGTPIAAKHSDDDGNRFSTAAARLFGEALGVFTEISERDFAQLPLNVSEVVLPLPVEGGGTRRVHGAGTTVRAARLAATARASELYAAAMVVPGRLVDPATAGPRAEPVEWTGPADALVWAHTVETGERLLVPAAAAFPVLAGADPASAAGLGSGTTREEAVSRGLSGHVAALAVARVDDPPAPLVALDGVNDPEVARHLRLLRTARHDFAVHDVSGGSVVPAFAFLSGDRTVAWTAGFDVPAALARGLTSVLLDHQCDLHGQDAYRPSAPPLPPPRRGDAVVQPPGSSTPGWGGWSRAFAASGLRPVVVDLDHDPAITAALPHVVNVLLVRR